MARTSDDATPAPGSPAGNARFATTRWSIVLRAGQGHDTGARDALERLCRTYWFPLYAYVRRRGVSPHDAEDLTQAFFARLLAQAALGRADRAQGRFRTFLLTALSRFLTDEWEKLRAQKRGGGREVVSLDLAAAEHRLGLEPVDRGDSPDAAFDRHWALTLLDAVLQRLEAEYAHAGKATQFALLKNSLVGRRDLQPYSELAVKVGTSEGAVKIAVHRLRKRYRELLQAEIDETVTTPEQAAEEMRDLFRAVGSA